MSKRKPSKPRPTGRPPKTQGFSPRKANGEFSQHTKVEQSEPVHEKPWNGWLFATNIVLMTLALILLQYGMANAYNGVRTLANEDAGWSFRGGPYGLIYQFVTGLIFFLASFVVLGPGLKLLTNSLPEFYGDKLLPQYIIMFIALFLMLFACIIGGPAFIAGILTRIGVYAHSFYKKRPINTQYVKLLLSLRQYRFVQLAWILWVAVGLLILTLYTFTRTDPLKYFFLLPPSQESITLLFVVALFTRAAGSSAMIWSWIYLIQSTQNLRRQRKREDLQTVPS